MDLLSYIIGLAGLLLILTTSQTQSVLSKGNKTLDSDLSPRIADFKLNLHRLLEGSRIRKKRQIQESNGPAEHQMRVGSSAAEELPYLSSYNLTFWIPVRHDSRNQVLVGTREGHLILFELSSADDRIGKILAISLQEEIASKAMAFSHYDEQWFAILQSSRNKTWIRFYLKVGRGLERRQSINLEGYTDFDLVTIKGVHYLVMVTFRTSNQHELLLYRWTQTQFDIIATRSIYGARSLACWVLDGNLYASVAQEMNDEGDLNVGSPIYYYNAKDDSGLILLDMLSTYGPKKVLHFYVNGGHYVIFIGRQDAAIYWWSNDQFLLWQTIEGTAHASDTSTLTLDGGEVVIIIALKEEALFLTLDASGHYIATFTMRFTGFSLSSLQFMYSGSAYYALALFEVSWKPHPHPIYKLTLDPFFIPTESSLDSLRQCLKDVMDMLHGRQTEIDVIQADLSRVWLKNRDQVIATEVIISGEAASVQPSSVTEVLVLVDHKILPDSSVPEVEAGITRLKSLADDAQQDIKASVLGSVPQEIKGPVHFDDSLLIPSLNMESTNIDVPINGVPISEANAHALRKSGDQTFVRPVIAYNIYADKVWTNTLNGVWLKDLLLLSGEQDVVGELKFFNVYAKDATVLTVNTIPVDHLVTVGSHQLIKDLKGISVLQSHTINVQGQTNGEDLNEVLKKIITVEEPAELKSRCIFDSTVYIQGDVSTGLINSDIDVSQLELSTVNKLTSQELEGPFVFTMPIHMQGHLVVDGHINGITTSQLMTVSTAQIIESDISFDGLLAVIRDLVVDHVNGIHLNEAALLKTLESQFVTGHKIFTAQLAADFVDMTEYVTLDGVDPSFLVQDIVKHKEGVVKHNDTVFHSVVVLGNVTAIEGVNGHDVFDLPGMVWLKSTPQVIEVPVTVSKVSFNDDIDVKLVNRLNLEKDIVHSYGDETVISVKYFEHNTVSDNVNAGAGSMINGFDVQSIQTQMDDFLEEGTVRGKKILQRLEIYGDIEPQMLNGLDVNYVMRPWDFQEVPGLVNFPSELTVVPGDFQANNVVFNTFNSINLHDFIDSAVSSVTPKHIVLNKGFSVLKGENLSMQNDGTLNGVNLSELLSRVVTLDTQQHILGEKTFANAIHLQKPSTVLTLNRYELSRIINNVVFTDESSSIFSPKEFTGNVSVQHIVVEGLLNGIDINLVNQSTFFKSSHNEVNHQIGFIGDIHVGRLMMGSFVDGVMWDDLIFLDRDETLGPTSFLSDSVSSADVFVTGLLNGCDLIQLGQRALYTSKPNQLIKEEITIEGISVIGNLNLKNSVNEISVEDLQKGFITVAGEQMINSNVRLGPEVKVENLDFAGSKSQEHLPFILNDAVKHSVVQEINGYKIFQDLKSGALTADDIFVRGRLDGVDVTELYKNAVTKNDSQMIEGEKMFKSMSADVVTLSSYINGLKLPEDVVKVDVSEHITSPVVFMSDLILPTDLHVRGNLDGVYVNQLINNRVTLGGDERVLSQLSFLRDVVLHNGLTIDGTVNGIVIGMVSKVAQTGPLDGYKAFLQNIPIFGSLFTSGINGYNINQLDTRTLRHNKEEIMNELQVFEKPLRAQSLSAERINSLSIPQMGSAYFTATVNFSQMKNYLEDTSYDYHQQISHQLQVAENRISRFAYFILIQEINLGPTTKILHGYRREHAGSEFSHSMVLWTSHKHCTYTERCCHTEFSHWTRVKKSGHMVVVAQVEHGKYYPVHNPGPVTSDQEFVVWTNSTDVRSKWCGNQWNERMFLASITQSGHYEAMMDIRNAPSLSEIKSFRHGHLYAVAGFYYDWREDGYKSAVVYEFNEVKRYWSEHQILPSYGVLSLDLTNYKRNGYSELLLAVGTGIGSYSSVYKWNDVEQEFDLLEKIPSQFVTSTLWLKQGGMQLLAMANVESWPKKGEDCLEFLSGGQVDIYTYQNRIRWIQSIPLRGVVSLVSFSLEGDTFLIAASHQLQTMFIYEWRGFAGFSLIQSMFVGEVRHLNVYTIEEEIYVTVAVASGPSKLLKVVVQGRHQSAVAILEPLPDAQKYEATNEDNFKLGC